MKFKDSKFGKSFKETTNRVGVAVRKNYDNERKNVHYKLAKEEHKQMLKENKENRKRWRQVNEPSNKWHTTGDSKSKWLDTSNDGKWSSHSKKKSQWLE